MYIWVLFFEHIPFVVNRTFNATPTERLQQHLFSEKNWQAIIEEKLRRGQKFRLASAHLDIGTSVSSEISDFTPYAHAQSATLHVKYAEKTDN